MFTDKYFEGKEWKNYQKFLIMKSSLFSNNDECKIVQDKRVILDFMNTHNQPIGCLFEVGNDEYFIVDLIESSDNTLFIRPRVLSFNNRHFICIPVYNGKFVLANCYVHSSRQDRFKFPLIIDELDIPFRDKEDSTEKMVKSIQYVGELDIDNRLTNTKVVINLYELNSLDITTDLNLIVPSKFDDMISDSLIYDAYTIAAYELFKNIQKRYNRFDTSVVFE